MKIETGFLYHIKDEYFDTINDKNIMINHSNGHSRPSYLAIKDKDILWFIPLSTKIDKYEKIIEKKNKKYGICRTIMIEKINGKKEVILLQNAFPTIEKYIKSIHITKGIPVKVTKTLERKIINNFHYMLSMKKQGNNLFFVNIDKIKEIMEFELKNVNLS